MGSAGTAGFVEEEEDLVRGAVRGAVVRGAVVRGAVVRGAVVAGMAVD